MKAIRTKAARISADQIAAAAAQGVARAQAARQAAVEELGAGDAEQVNGGAFSLKFDPMIYGYYRDWLKGGGYAGLNEFELGGDVIGAKTLGA
jgi:hypothetical protein